MHFNYSVSKQGCQKLKAMLSLMKTYMHCEYQKQTFSKSNSNKVIEILSCSTLGVSLNFGPNYSTSPKKALKKSKYLDL